MIISARGAYRACVPGPGVLLGRLAIAAGVVAVLPMVAFVWAMLFYDGRQDIDLDSWADGDDYSAYLMPGARWATDELCGSDVPCVQAVASETLTMYRFEYRELARAAAAYWGEDAYLTGWIVVRFEPGGLSPDDRYAFEGSVGCINTWVSEDGRDC
jgi:hypothetical protein